MVLALFMAVPALAQENLDAGKSPAQLYAQDCAICHKTPHGLSKAGGRWSLQNFLREHYTASRESAAAIAAYLTAIDRKSPASARAGHRPHKNEKAKKAGAKQAPQKPSGAKAEVKPESTPDEAKAKSGSTPESKPETKAEPDKAKAIAKGSKDAKDGKPEKKSD